MKVDSRLTALLGMLVAQAGCGGTSGTAANERGDAGTGGPDAGGADVASPSSTCGGPEAHLSLGAYPADVPEWMSDEYALRGTVLGAGWPAVCGGGLGLPKGDTFRLDEVLWGAEQGFAAGVSVEVNEQPLTRVGHQLVIFGTGGTFPGPAGGCTATYDVHALDLAQYPTAVVDAGRLRSFLRDQNDYEIVRAGQQVVDATVIAIGNEVRPREDSFWYSRDVTLAITRTLCGEAASQLGARYIGLANGDVGRPNPAGDMPPAPGSHLIFVLGPHTIQVVDGPAPAPNDIQYVFPADAWTHLSALHASPPALSL